MNTPANHDDNSTMAAVFHHPERPLSLERLPLPRPEAGEALVQIECCTICGSDLHTLTGARIEKTPAILGHEICGRVVAVSPTRLRDIDTTPLSVGDRVTWSVAVSCGQCDRCQRGLPQKCRTLAKFGHESTEGDWPLSGGLARHVLLPVGTQVVRLPESLPAEVACPANCATATVVAACRAAGPVSGRRVLIFGAGMLGLTATAYAHSQSAARILVCDRDPSRLAWGERCGAHGTIVWSESATELRQSVQGLTGDGEFDIVLEMSGSPDAIEAGCALCDIGAKVVLVGSVMKSRAARIDPETLVRRLISIHGVHNYTPDDLRTAVRFLAENHMKYPLGELVARTFALDDINTAIPYAVRNRPVRIAIVP